MRFPTSYQGVRCVQVLGPPASVHINHLKTPEELQEFVPSSYQGERCVQVLGPPAPAHMNHLKSPEDLQEGWNFKGASFRLRSLTEQTHIKIRVKIPESLSATNKHQQSLVSIVKQLGS